VESLEGYDDLIDWPPANLNLKSSNISHTRSITEECDEETDVVQSKERWAFVKVNMDGVVVGRKICILDHGSFSSLALQLEEMFGGYQLSYLKIENSSCWK
jgi:auxin-responsive protein IAA